MNHVEPQQRLGTTIGGYLLESIVGVGATGVVFEATREGLPDPVALKVLSRGFGEISGLKERFVREARALRRLRHENVVEVIDYGVDGDDTFIAMELLEGESLEDELAGNALDPKRAVSIVIDVLRGLAEAHDQGLVHRDLKPANVFLSLGAVAETVKLLDFGLVKFLSSDIFEEEREGEDDVTLTRRGRVVGTPAYMAPEQVTGTRVDVRADVYAAGVLLFELLADRRPFDYDSRDRVMRAHLFETPPGMMESRPGLWVTPELELTVAQALAKDPRHRFENAAGMLNALLALPEDVTRVDEAADVQRRRERERPSPEVITEEARRQLATRRPATSRAPDEVAGVGTIDLTATDSTGEGAPIHDAAILDGLARGAEEPAPETSRYPAMKQSPRWLSVLVWCLGFGLLLGIVAAVVWATQLR